MSIGAQNRGYTIVEVMIFLVVSSFILSTAFVAFNGRQFQVQYEQGVRDLDLKLMSYIGNVSNGRYPPDSRRCTSPSSGPLQFDATPTEQGKSDQCVFAGIAVELIDDETIKFTSIAAAKQRIGRSLSVMDPDARLTPISSSEELYVSYGGLKMVKMVDNNGNPLPSLLVLSNLGQPAISGSSQVGTGTQSINLYASGAPVQNNTLITPSDPSRPIFLCLESSDSSKKAVITLGNQGRELTTSIDQDAEGKYTQCD